MNHTTMLYDLNLCRSIYCYCAKINTVKSLFYFAPDVVMTVLLGVLIYL